jgi:hypothetical protein
MSVFKFKQFGWYTREWSQSLILRMKIVLFLHLHEICMGALKRQFPDNRIWLYFCVLNIFIYISLRINAYGILVIRRGFLFLSHVSILHMVKLITKFTVFIKSNISMFIIGVSNLVMLLIYGTILLVLATALSDHCS